MEKRVYRGNAEYQDVTDPADQSDHRVHPAQEAVRELWGQWGCEDRQDFRVHQVRRVNQRTCLQKSSSRLLDLQHMDPQDRRGHPDHTDLLDSRAHADPWVIQAKAGRPEFPEPRDRWDLRVRRVLVDPAGSPACPECPDYRETVCQWQRSGIYARKC